MSKYAPYCVWDSATHDSRMVDIESLTNDQLIDEYASKCEGESRRISTDPPSRIVDLRKELDERLSKV